MDYESTSKSSTFYMEFHSGDLADGVKVIVKIPRWSNKCPFCNQKESQHHLFLECSWSCGVWTGTPWGKAFTIHGAPDCMLWVKEVLKNENSDIVEHWAI
ncbi:unnamed protein product [Linum trigynum]|uniref:Reverse transcriptase zinc-binding domain-containing protein n=1 Tax=Linum trigynum TaxID=586398 RepID=A0AAV2CZ21_9ROSI